MKASIVAFFIFLIAVHANPSPSQSSFNDVLEGFLSTMNERKEFNNVIICLKDANEVLSDLAEAWNLILKFNYDDFVKAMELIGKALLKLIVHFKDCERGYEELKKIEEAIKKLEVFNVLRKIVLNVYDFRSYATEFVISMRIGDFLEVGRVMGQVTYRILFKFSEDKLGVGAVGLNLCGIFNFTEGFFIGLGNGTQFANIARTQRYMGRVLGDILHLIDLIRELNFFEAFSQVFLIGHDLFLTVKHLVIAIPEKFSLLLKLLTIDFSKSYERLILHQLEIMRNFGWFLEDLIDGHLKDAGKSLGHICYLLIIKE